MKRRHLISLAAAATLGLGTVGAVAQSSDYPNKPIRIVVPFVPGGPVDVMARMLSEQLTQSLKATVVVENKPGAGGNLGSQYVAKSAADGYTLLLATGSILTINESLYSRLGFEPAKDFAPVSLVGDMPLIVTVNAQTPVRSLKELGEWVVKQNKPLTLSSPGNGTTPHLAAELYKRESKLDVLHVPYKGGAESATAILSKQVDGGIETPPSVLPHIQSGAMRALAVAGPARLASLPDVPTTAEVGLPNLQIITWFGLVAPAGTPAPVVQKLNAEVARALTQDSVRERFAKLAIRPVSSSPAEMDQLAQKERVKWADVVKGAGIKLD